jgi:succinate dehydrogenase/fumarate reductase cytochrome b subunit
MKTSKKIFAIFLILSVIFSNVIYALDSAISDPNGNPSVDSGISQMVNVILGAIQWIGYAIAIGMLIYVGIKYLMSSANEKATLKQDSINLLIGAIVIFAAVTICTWCVKFFKSAGGGGAAGGSTPDISAPSGSAPIIGAE